MLIIGYKLRNYFSLVIITNTFNYNKVSERTYQVSVLAMGVYEDKALQNKWLSCKILRTAGKKIIYTQNRKKAGKTKKEYLYARVKY